MSKRRFFSEEFKQEAVSLVVDQGYSLLRGRPQSGGGREPDRAMETRSRIRDSGAWQAERGSAACS